MNQIPTFTVKQLCACGCGQTVRDNFLSCPDSWHALPRPLRLKIWRLYRHDQGSREHLAAIAEAMSIIRGMNPAINKGC